MDSLKLRDWKKDFSDSFVNIVIMAEIGIILLYGIFTEYTPVESNVAGTDRTEMDHYYPLYQDVHVMIFVGFGFLMTFLHKFGFSAVALNFFLAAFTIQWSMLTRGFWERAFHSDPWGYIELDIKGLISADFSAAVVLITYGVLIGRATPLQLFLIAIVETVFSTLNETIALYNLEAVDMGGSFTIHMFGGYFGIAVSYMLRDSHQQKCVKHSAGTQSTYNADLFAMIGTLFLWMFWPSYNAALALESSQKTVIVNTLLSLSGSCVAVFVASRFLNHAKFDMVHIQNATLAGGVAVGSSSDLVLKPFGALLVGTFAGLLSVLGYVYMTPFLERKFRILDTCGVHNLHAMPGLLGGIVGSISASQASSHEYGQPIGNIFRARNYGRTASEQAGFQMAAVGYTFLIAVGSGLLTGWFVSRFTDGPSQLYHDRVYWHVPAYSKKVDDEESAISEPAKVEMMKVAHSEVSEISA